MIFVSDREMLPIVRAPAMQPISNRLSGQFLLQPLTRQETTNYVYRKLQSGGCKSPQTVVPPAVCERLHAASGGWPGVIDRLIVLAISRADRCPLRVEHVPAPPATKERAARAVDSGPKLILTCRRKTLLHIPLNGSRIIIGRDETSDLRVDDDFVSRQHAVILRRGGMTLIADLKSRNGTYVNGKRVKRLVLVNSDIISLGDHRLKLIDPSAKHRTMVQDAGWDDTTIARSLELPRGKTGQPARHKTAG